MFSKEKSFRLCFILCLDLQNPYKSKLSELIYPVLLYSLQYVSTFVTIFNKKTHFYEMLWNITENSIKSELWKFNLCNKMLLWDLSFLTMNTASTRKAHTETRLKNRKRTHLDAAWGFNQQSSDKQAGPTGTFNTPVNMTAMCGWNITQLEWFWKPFQQNKQIKN